MEFAEGLAVPGFGEVVVEDGGGAVDPDHFLEGDFGTKAAWVGGVDPGLAFDGARRLSRFAGRDPILRRWR